MSVSNELRAAVAGLVLVLASAGAGGAEAGPIVHRRDDHQGAFRASELAFDSLIDPGNDRYLLVSVVTGGTTPGIQSVTFAGTRLGLIGAVGSPSGSCRLEWWGLVAPAEGMHPFRLQLAAPADQIGVTLISYSGVEPLGAIGRFVPAIGGTGPSLVNIPSVGGEIILDGVCGWAPDSVIETAGPGQRARWHFSSGSLSSAGSQKVGGEEPTLTWTASGPGVMEWAAAGVLLRPSGVGRTLPLDVHTVGCALAGPLALPGPLVPLVLSWVLALWAVRRRRTLAGPGTITARSRETPRRPMRPSTSHLALAEPQTEPDLDEVTLARAKAGDPRAQAAIVHRYQRPIYSLLWRMVGPEREVVQDLTQETFLRVLRALTRFEYDGRARLITWILTIATRLALDHLRAARPRSDVTIVPGGVPVALPRPDQEADRRRLGGALVQAVNELSAPFRAAFLLRELHGLSYDEISLALHIDVGTVRSRLSRARATLQAALAEMRDE